MATLTKTSNESRVYQFDFTQFAEIVASQTLTGTPTITATPADELTIGTPAIEDGEKVNVRISEGVNETSYCVTCIVTTSGGSTLEGSGILLIKDCC